MTEPQVIRRTLSVHFGRAVTFPNETPAVMQVSVIPLNSASMPDAGLTFVEPSATQEIVLAQPDNVVRFGLLPSHAGGLTEPILYRIQWRAGITGRMFTETFSMPDIDVRFDQLRDLGQLIDAENYLRWQDLGVPGRVARLSSEGHVLDASGQTLATTGAVNTLSGQLQAEALARSSGDAAVAQQAQAALETQITSALNTMETRLTQEVGSLEATADEDRAARASGDAALDGRLDTAEETISDLVATADAHGNLLPLKADLVGGKLDPSQLPTEGITAAVTVADQTAMLALTTAQVQPGDLAVRPDGTFLLRGANPGQLSNWLNISTVTGVNGKRGAVTLTLTDVAAAGGEIDIDQVDGLAEALANAGDAEALEELEERVEALEPAESIVRLVDGVIPHELNSDRMVYLSEANKIVDKDGNALTVPGTGSVTEVNGQDGIVTLTLSDIAAEGGEIAISQVADLQDALDAKADSDDERLTDARTPTTHASSHGSGGSDPITVAASQVTGLSAIISNNGLSSSSNHENRIQALELGGGGGEGGGEIAKASWFDGTDDFEEVEDPADFKAEHSVLLKGPFSVDDDGKFTYSPGGIAPSGNEYVYPYISKNGHLELRRWDESAPPDPEYATASDLSDLEEALGDKADQSALDLLVGSLGSKADQSTVTALATTVGGKADQSTVTALATTVSGKASASDLTAAQGAITALQNGKANLSGGTVPLTELPAYPVSKVTNLQALLDARPTLTSGLLSASVIPALAQNKITGLDTALAGKADLVDGKINPSQLPDLALTKVTTVANKAAMLAQTSSQVQPGDITIITATSDIGNYILSGTNPAVEANWVKLVTPSGSVSSVNSKTGTVVLTAADVGARSLADLLAISDVADLQSALDGKASVAALTSGLASKTGPSDVDTQISNAAQIKLAVDRVATTAVASLSGAQSIDGAVVSAGTRVLLTNQASSINNGIWLVQTGAWTRPTDFATGTRLIRGAIVVVTSGTTNASTIWQNTAASAVIGTGASNWSRIGYVAARFAPVEGNGIQVTDGNTFAVRQGPGISVSSAGVGINTGVVARKATGAVPSGSTNVTLTHNLDTTSPVVQIIEVASGLLVAVGIQVTGANTVAVEFGSAPASNQYRWVAIG